MYITLGQLPSTSQATKCDRITKINTLQVAK